MYNYNIEYICRYNKDDIFLESDNVTNEEKDYIRDILYKEDLTNIFNLKENDDFDCVNDILFKIYDKVKNNKDFKACMIKAASLLLSQDIQAGLFILYSYDYMYLTHDCVSEYLKSKIISEDKIKKLKEYLNLNK